MKDMRQIFSKFSRSDKSQETPVDWPQDVAQLEYVAQQLRLTSQRVSKKVSNCCPSLQLSSGGIPMLLSATNGFSSHGQETNPSNSQSKSSQFLQSVKNRRSKSDGMVAAEEKEKRLGRLPESVLSRVLLESSERFDGADCAINLRNLFHIAGEALQYVAHSRLTMEYEVEQGLLMCLRSCSDSQVPSLLKNRKHLCKLTSEWRTVSQRLASASTSVNDRETTSLADNIISRPLDFTSPLVENKYELSKSQSSLCSVNNGHHSKTNKKKPTEPLMVSISGGTDQSCGSASSTPTPVTSPAPPLFPINNTNSPIAPTEKAKVQQLRSLKEELETSLIQARDQSLKEFYRFDGSLVSYGETFISYVEQLSDYHRQCTVYLDEMVEKMRQEMGLSCKIPVFERPLEEHLEITQRSLAYVLQVCIEELSTQRCLLEEGIFRIAGSKAKVDTLTSALNVMRAQSILPQCDPFVIADALKQYLRTLPTPLLCSTSSPDDWHLAVQLTNLDDQLRSLWNCCSRLPNNYWYNLGYLMRYLHRVSSHSAHNRMTPANLGIILAPTLLPNHHDERSNNMATTQRNGIDSAGGGDLSARLAAGSMSNLVVELLITYANSFFPEDVEQYLVLPPTASTPMPVYATVRRVPNSQSQTPTTTTKDHSNRNDTRRILTSGSTTLDRKKTRGGVSHLAFTNNSTSIVDSQPLTPRGTKTTFKFTPSIIHTTSVGPIKAVIQNRRISLGSSSNIKKKTSKEKNSLDVSDRVVDDSDIGNNHHPQTSPNSPYPLDFNERDIFFWSENTNSFHKNHERRSSDSHFTPSESCDVTQSTDDELQSWNYPIDDNINNTLDKNRSSGQSNKSIHSDVYDTMFALQAIRGGNGGCGGGNSITAEHSRMATPTSLSSSCAESGERMRSVYEGRQFAPDRSIGGSMKHDNINQSQDALSCITESVSIPTFTGPLERNQTLTIDLDMISNAGGPTTPTIMSPTSGQSNAFFNTQQRCNGTGSGGILGVRSRTTVSMVLPDRAGTALREIVSGQAAVPHKKESATIHTMSSNSAKDHIFRRSMPARMMTGSEISLTSADQGISLLETSSPPMNTSRTRIAMASTQSPSKGAQ